MKNAKRDVWIGGGAIAIAILGWFVAIPFGVDVPGSVKIKALSPDFWPNIIMGMLASCGAVVLVQGFLAKSTNGDGATGASDNDISDNEVVHFDAGGQTLRVAVAFLCLFAFYFLSPIIGVVVGCSVLVLAATRILGVKSWVKSAGLAVTLPTLLYFFFTQVAHIPIPLGLFEQLR